MDPLPWMAADNSEVRAPLQPVKRFDFKRFLELFYWVLALGCFRLFKKN